MDEGGSDRSDRVRYGTLWRRWTDGTGAFYTACAVIPFDSIRELPEPAPVDEQADDASDEKETIGDETSRPDVQVLHGPVRLFVRNIPTLLLLGAALSIVGEQVGDYYSPIGTYLPIAQFLPTGNLLYAPAALLAGAWFIVLAKLFTDAGANTDSQFHKTAVFYGTSTVLLAGVVFSLYLVWAGSLTDPRQHLTFRAGWFLFLLVVGHLAYDGIVLRTETLFSNLGDNKVTTEHYDSFREDLVDALGDNLTWPVDVSRASAFAFLFLAPVAPLPVLTIGMGHWAQYVSYGITVVMQFVLIAVLFQFGVLLRHFNKLLSSDRHLEYKPFHADEHGGYRDLGRFAMRVNVVLVVAGAYVAFRFYIGGIRVLQHTTFGDVLDVLRWVTSFVGPIVVYGLVVLLWLYFSFWRMHRDMMEGRREKIEELQRESGGGEGDSLNSDATAFEALQSAPVWPVSRGSLVAIVVIDAIPIAMSSFI